MTSLRPLYWVLTTFILWLICRVTWKNTPHNSKSSGLYLWCIHLCALRAQRWIRQISDSLGRELPLLKASLQIWWITCQHLVASKICLLDSYSIWFVHVIMTFRLLCLLFIMQEIWKFFLQYFQCSCVFSQSSITCTVEMHSSYYPGISPGLEFWMYLTFKPQRLPAMTQ